MTDRDDLSFSPEAEALVAAWLGAHAAVAPAEISTELLVRYLCADLPPETASQVETACLGNPLLRRRLLETQRELHALRSAAWAELDEGSASQTAVREAWMTVLRGRLSAMSRVRSAWNGGWERLRRGAATGAAEAWTGIQALRNALAAELEAPARAALARSGAAGVEAEVEASGALSVRAPTAAPEGTDLRLLVVLGGEEWPLGTARVAKGSATWRFEGFADFFGAAAERIDPASFVVRGTEADPPEERRALWAEVRGGGSAPRRVPLEVLGPVRWERGFCHLTITAEPEVRRQVEGWLLILELRLAPSVAQLLGTHLLSAWPESGCEIRIPCPGAPDQLLPFLPLLHLTLRPPGLP